MGDRVRRVSAVVSTGDPSVRDCASATERSRRTLLELASVLDQIDDDDTGEHCDTFLLRSQRWHLMERVLTARREYLVLRLREAPDSPLTSRERTAVRLVMGGATHKEVAWLLGVTASTVGVFLWRAARKLGVVGRESLLRAFAERHPDDHAMAIAEWQGSRSL